jgi:hypothetical protein
MRRIIIMTTMAIQMGETLLKDRVLETLHAQPLEPTELVRTLHGAGPQREIEIALSDLLDEGSVKFESDGLLHATEYVGQTF